MDAARSHPVIATTTDALFGLSSTIAQHLRTIEPMTWTMVAVVTGALWVFMVKGGRS